MKGKKSTPKAKKSPSKPAGTPAKRVAGIRSYDSQIGMKKGMNKG